MILIISQIIGLAAVGLYLLSYQLKKRKQIVWTTFFSNFLYVVQYILLKAFSGAVMDALCAVGSFFAGKKTFSQTQPLYQMDSDDKSCRYRCGGCVYCYSSA